MPCFRRMLPTVVSEMLCPRLARAPWMRSTEDLALDRQASALVVVEPDPILAMSFLQDLVLGAQVLDDLLLLPVDQAGEDG